MSKFGIKVAYGTRMMHTLRFLGKKIQMQQNLLIKKTKNGPKNTYTHSSPCGTTETTNSRNAEIGTNIARSLRMIPNFWFSYYSLL